MTELEKKILKFLVDGKAYSDTALMKNFGIDYEELQNIYRNLEIEGYLESYEIYQERNSSQTSSRGCTGACSSGGCGGGGCGGGGCSSCSSDEEDALGEFKEIWVLTSKAIIEFS